MTLLDALTRAVVTPVHEQNVRLYVDALTLLSLRDDLDDFREFLEQPIMTTFVDQSCEVTWMFWWIC